MNKFFAAVAFAVTASVSQAAILDGTLAGVPTTDLPGFTTYTLTLELEAGETFRGVNASFNGPMNQVNPFGSASIFTDSNNAIDFVANVSQDSQFLFASGDVLAIGATESATELSAAIQGLSIDSGVVPFAQLAIPDGEEVAFSLEFDLGGPEAVVFTGIIPIPEPAAAMIAGLGVVGFAGRRRS